MYVRPTWFDVSTRWQMLTTALRLNPGFKVPEGIDETTWWEDAKKIKRVTRRQVVDFHVDELGWRELGFKDVKLTNVVADVGRSSYTTSGVAMDGSNKVYSVRTTIVAVDDSLQRSIALPNADRLLKAMESSSGTEMKKGNTEDDPKPRPADAFCWQTITLHTGCDQLGHLNQSQYALLIEEARAVASQAGGYGKASAIAYAPPLRAQINYMGQAKAGDVLCVFTWWDGECFCSEVERKDAEQGSGHLLTTGRVWVSTTELGVSKL